MATWGQVCDQYEYMNVILAKLLIFVSFSKALYMHKCYICLLYTPQGRQMATFSVLKETKKLHELPLKVQPSGQFDDAYRGYRKIETWRLYCRSVSI